MLAYNSSGISRMHLERRDPDRIQELRASAAAKTVLFHEQAIIQSHGFPIMPSPQGADRLGLPSKCECLLGVFEGEPCFVRDVSAVPLQAALEAVCAHGATDLRRLVATLPSSLSAILAYGRGLLHWNNNQRYCGGCGYKTILLDGGHRRQCEGCRRDWFPRIEPAVIVLVESPDGEACLLAKHRSGSGEWSTLAGFVEIGESLEDAARREVMEEAGVAIEHLSYFASQAWPFPAGMMVGFLAQAATTRIKVDRDELHEAAWLTRCAVRKEILETDPPALRPDSIETALLSKWLGRHSEREQ